MLFRSYDSDKDTRARLLGDIRPEEFYPVYGDDSTVAFDTESQGKLFLAVESDAIAAVVGNYRLALTDSELSAYQRSEEYLKNAMNRLKKYCSPAS